MVVVVIMLIITVMVVMVMVMVTYMFWVLCLYIILSPKSRESQHTTQLTH